jgi:hypothetical protein
MDGCGALLELPAGERIDQGPRIGLGERSLHGGTVAECDRFVVPAEGNVHRSGQDCPLGPEQPIHGRDRSVARLRNGLHRRGRVAALEEEIPSRPQHLLAGRADPGLASGIVVRPGLDIARHIGDSSTIK